MIILISVGLLVLACLLVTHSKEQEEYMNELQSVEYSWKGACVLVMSVLFTIHMFQDFALCIIEANTVGGYEEVWQAEMRENIRHIVTESGEDLDLLELAVYIMDDSVVTERELELFKLLYKKKCQK
jgi:AAA+ superfamily predicted ATPase